MKTWKHWTVVLAGCFAASFLGVQLINEITDPSPWSPRPVADTIAACDQEDGSGDRQVYPCVWDARVRGDDRVSTYPVTIYFQGTKTTCPVPAGTTAVCVDVDGWMRDGS